MPDQIGPIATEFNGDLQHGVSTLGRLGLLLLFLHAYSLGGGTYTGIEAVSNGIQMMREPRVQVRKTDHDLYVDVPGPHGRGYFCLLSPTKSPPG